MTSRLTKPIWAIHFMVLAFLMTVGTQVSAATVYQCTGTVGNGYDHWKPEYKVYANRTITLGTMYQFGHGVIEDHKAAQEWYRLSAIQGNNDGQHGLGVMYMQGIATLADNIKSHMWFNIGSANGHSQSAYWRDNVELKMTSADISKAQSMARECMNSGYTKCGY